LRLGGDVHPSVRDLDALRDIEGIYNYVVAAKPGDSGEKLMLARDEFANTRIFGR